MLPLSTVDTSHLPQYVCPGIKEQVVPSGRCAGCGETDVSSKKIEAHTLECSRFMELFRTSPDKALDPVAEHIRWQASGLKQRAVEEARDERLGSRALELDEARRDSIRRWKKPPDPLAD